MKSTLGTGICGTTYSTTTTTAADAAPTNEAKHVATASVAARVSSQAAHGETVAASIGSTMHASSGHARVRRTSAMLAMQCGTQAVAKGGERGGAECRPETTGTSTGQDYAAAIVSRVCRAAKIAVVAGMIGLTTLGLVGPAVAAVAGQQPTAIVQVQASSQAVQASSIQDVVARWRPGQNVYTVGDVEGAMRGIEVDNPSAQLNELQQWLAANHPNWTVTFISDAQLAKLAQPIDGDARGEQQVMHRGIANKPEFMRLVDARTGEASGVMLTVVMRGRANDTGPDGRRVTYYASQAYDARAIGEANWIGNLDQTFISAMRQGQQIFRGVKDTVTSIDQQLASGIAREAREAAQQLETAKARVETAATSLASAENAHREFAGKYGARPGDLGAPPVAQWRANVEGARTALAAKDVRAATSMADAVVSAAGGYAMAVHEFGRVPARLDAVAARLASGEARERASAGASSFAAAREEAKLAKAAWESGSSSYLGTLQTAEALSTQGIKAIDDADASAAQARQAMWLTTAGVLAGLMGLAVFANLRRRKVKGEAEERFKAIERDLNERLDDLFKLVDQSAMIVGNTPEEALKLYSGRTLELAKDLIDKVGDLVIMANVAQGKHVAPAKGLIFPEGVVAKLQNLFSAGHYREGLALLRDTPVSYDHGSPLDLALHGGSEGGQRWLASLTRELGQSNSFSMNFEQLIETFRTSAESARGTLERIKHTDLTAKTALGEIAATTKLAALRANELTTKSAVDGMFVFPEAQATIIPAVEKLLGDAEKLRANKDPIGAVEGAGAEAQRVVSDTEALSSVGITARTDVHPSIEGDKQRLQASSVATAWVDKRFADLSARFTTIAGQVVARSVNGDAEQLRVDVAALKQDVGTAVALDERRRTASPATIADAANQIDRARDEIGKTLGFRADQTMREAARDPSAHVAAAEQALQRSKALLDAGAVTDTRDALDRVDTEANTARSLTARSLDSLRTHGSVVQARQGEQQRLAGVAGERDALFGKLKGEYAAHVVQDVAGAVADARRQLGVNDQSITEAQAAYKKASLLAAADLLATAEAGQKSAQATLDRVTAKQTSLRQTDEANARAFATLEAYAARIRGSAADSRTRGPARGEAERAIRDALAQKGALTAAGRDPAEVARRIDAASQALRGAETRIDADWRAHASAVQAIAGAQAAISRAQSYRGSEGVTCSVSSFSLAAASAALASGDYEGAVRAADSVESSALSALRRAESENDSLYRDRMRREEEERRRRQREEDERRRRDEDRRSSSSSSSSWSSGSGSSSSSW